MPTSETELKTRENVAEPKPARSIQSGVKQLKRIRQQLIKALAEAADGPPAMIDGLTARIQSLSTAIDAIGKGEGKVRDQRITLAAVTGAVLLTGTLLLLHRTSAEILMETKASDVSFTVTTPFAPLRDVAGVASVELVGLAKISQRGGAAAIVARPDEDLRMRVASAPGTKNPGSVGFDSLLIPAGTRVEFTELGSGKNIELRFQFPTGQTSDHNHEYYRQHHRVLGDVLPLLLKP